MIDPAKIYSFLNDELKNKIKILSFEQVTSTNDLAFDCAPNTLVVASSQTAGRGREGRAFYSGEGGVYISLALSADDINRLTVRCAAAVARAIGELGFSVGIKWVNDLIVGGKKVCGILCESKIMGDDIRAVAGVGVNLDGEIPSDLKDIASSLKVKSGAEKFIASALTHFYLDGDFMDYYRKNSLVIGKRVEADGKIYTAVDIDCDGGLVLEADGIRTVKCVGEIRIPLSSIKN